MVEISRYLDNSKVIVVLKVSDFERERDWESSSHLKWAGSGVGDIGNNNVICQLERDASKFLSRESRQDKNQGWIKVILALLYKRTSKERWNKNPPTPNNLSLYTLHLPPSKHSPCSNVTFEYPTMILHTIITTLITTTMPHHPTSQHLKPLSNHNRFYGHPSAIPSRHSRVSWHLRLSVTLIPSASLILFLCTPQPITHNPIPDSILLLGSRSSENYS